MTGIIYHNNVIYLLKNLLPLQSYERVYSIGKKISSGDVRLGGWSAEYHLDAEECH